MWRMLVESLGRFHCIMGVMSKGVHYKLVTPAIASRHYCIINRNAAYSRQQRSPTIAGCPVLQPAVVITCSSLSEALHLLHNQRRVYSDNQGELTRRDDKQVPSKEEAAAKKDKGPLPFHPDDIPGYTKDHNPIGRTPEEWHEYFTEGNGRYYLVLFSIMLFLFVESRMVDYIPQTSYLIGKQKESEVLFQPLQVTMDSMSPYGNTVRTFLEYYGFTYTLVEQMPPLLCSGLPSLVNTMERRSEGSTESHPLHAPRQIFSDDVERNKLPRLQLGNKIVLNDAAFGISVFMSYLLDGGKQSLWQIIDRYPFIIYDDANVRESRWGPNLGRRFVINCRKYDVKTSDGTSPTSDSEWRVWADTTLTHHLFMTSHDTVTASVTACARWSRDAEWHRAYSYLMCHTGRWLDVLMIALRMYRHSNKLKERYNVEGSVKDALERELAKWVQYLEKHGDDQSTILVQLNVFGVLNAFHTCHIVSPMIHANKKLSTWYQKMYKQVKSSAGAESVHFKDLSDIWAKQVDTATVTEYLTRQEVEKAKVRLRDEIVSTAKIGTDMAADRGVAVDF